MVGWRGHTDRELAMYGLAGAAVVGTLAMPLVGPVFGVGLVLLGYAEHGYETDAAETGWQLVVVGFGLAAVGGGWTALALVI